MDAREGEDPRSGLRHCRQPGSAGGRPNPRQSGEPWLSLAHVQRLRTTCPLGRVQPDDAGSRARDSRAAVRARLPQSEMVRINDMAPVMRASGNGVELVPMNFSFASSGAKGGPVFNFRSEGRDFSNSGRCLVPARGFLRVHRHQAARSVGETRIDMPSVRSRRQPTMRRTKSRSDSCNSVEKLDRSENQQNKASRGVYAPDHETERNSSGLYESDSKLSSPHACNCDDGQHQSYT
jgi:hypothetical protein